MKESDFLREHPRFCGTRKFRPYKTWTKSNFQVCFSLTINRMVEMKYLTDRYPMLTCNCTMTITSVNNASVTTIKKWRHQMNMRQKIMSLTNKKFAPFNQWTSPFQKGKFIDLRDILINHVNSLSCKDEISRYYYCHKLKYNNLCLTNISRRMNWGTKLYLGRPNAIKNLLDDNI